MVYIFNKYIPPKKTIKNALTCIYGVGSQRALEISNHLCINPNTRFYKLKTIQISNICKYLSSPDLTKSGTFKVSSSLQRETRENIKKAIKIRSYKGIRHKHKLPARGQRTHTNAQTRKRCGLYPTKS